jgi:two-component system, OmpR family, sensor histidine kinase CreC
VSLRSRIFAVFVACVVGGMGWMVYWINGELRIRYNESAEAVLVDAANLLAEQLAVVWQRPETQRIDDLAATMAQLAQRTFSAQIYSFRKTTSDLRVYVTDNDGRLLYHSVAGHIPGEDFSNWTDISRTLAGKYGARTTREPVTGEDGRPQLVAVSYVAAPIFVGDTFVGVVSLGKPETNIGPFLDNARRQLRNVALLTGVAAIGLALLLYAWVTRPLQALVEYAQSVSRGDPVAVPVLGDNEVGRVGEAMDAMRRALEDKQYVESYVQSLTHEIKSPLTGIRASAELLAGELPPERRQGFAAAIERESNRLNNLADRLLELASLERARGLTHAEPVALFHLAEEAVASARTAGAARRLTLETQWSGDDAMTGDPLLLRQAIDNLVRNAIDFSPDGGLITVTGQPVGSSLQIVVQDQGPGIPDYALEHVFDRFYSLPRPHSGRKSTGLGLNFVREVVQLHGGLVTVSSHGGSRGGGTTATLRLPRRLVRR